GLGIGAVEVLGAALPRLDLLHLWPLAERFPCLDVLVGGERGVVARGVLLADLTQERDSLRIPEIGLPTVRYRAASAERILNGLAKPVRVPRKPAFVDRVAVRRLLANRAQELPDVAPEPPIEAGLRCADALANSRRLALGEENAVEGLCRRAKVGLPALLE